MLSRFLLFIFLGIFPFLTGSASSQDQRQSGLRIATFDVDATPPVGSRLAYNTMINVWELGLRARGIVITGAGQPIVLCSLDWIGIANEGQDVFKKSLAEAAGTVPQRVTVHTIHQHDAPACDFAVERMLKEAGQDLAAFDGTFAREVVNRLQAAIKQGLAKSQPVTHIGVGQGQVYKVASNRRILGPDGKVKAGRMSSCRDSALIAEPEGLIDPMVSLISFWNGEKPVAVLSYYAVHPQSYYMTGVANPDYPGVARFIRQLALPDVLQVHFNGAGGNVAAGKYNDGTKEQRGILGQRLADGMKSAWENTKREPVTAAQVKWTYEPVSLPPAANLEKMKTQVLENMKNKKRPFDNENVVTNNMSKIPFLMRCKAGEKINIECLSLGKARILFMPGELAIEYQLAAKAERKDLFVAMAAYGDYGTGYICTDLMYTQGGYEAGQASATAPGTEGILMAAIKKLLKD